MSLHSTKTASTIYRIFKEKLSSEWPKVKEYARAEAKKLADNLKMIERMKLAGTITDEQARIHHDIQRNAARTVLLATEGLGLIVVENAINAAMDALKVKVNNAVGFSLL